MIPYNLKYKMINMQKEIKTNPQAQARALFQHLVYDL